jgi:hypothetical protein
MEAEEIDNAKDEEEEVVVAQLWGRPLAGGEVAAVFFNRGESSRDITATFAELGISATVSTVTIVDVWSGDRTANVSSPITATDVAAHGAWFVTLVPE